MEIQKDSHLLFADIQNFDILALSEFSIIAPKIFLGYIGFMHTLNYSAIFIPSEQKVSNGLDIKVNHI